MTEPQDTALNAQPRQFVDADAAGASLTPMPLSARHEPFIDVLRAVAVLLVVGWHYFSMSPAPFIRLPILTPLFSFGQSGVQIFFVISGYLLGGQLIDHRREHGAIKTFYIRRVARILPPYAILLAMVAVAFPAADLRAPLTMTQNIVWALTGETPARWLVPTWTLAIEEQFYLLLPAVIFLIRPQKLATVLLAICILSLCCYALALNAGYPVSAHYLLPCQATGFAFGVLLAKWTRERSGPAWRLPAPSPLVWLGRRSYAIYLFHVPIADMSAHLAGRGLPGLALALLGTLGFCALLYVTFERPILDWARQRWRYGTPGRQIAWEVAGSR